MAFVDMYLEDFEQVRELYTYNPKDEKAYQQRANFLDTLDYSNRSCLVDLLLRYNKKLGCGETTINNIQRLTNKDTLCVVTGQQAGIFTGPLYTIYKACTTVLLAKKLEQELKRNIIPVFWIASEDHDFEEINHIFLPNLKGKPQKVSLSERPEGKFSIGEIPITENLEKLFQELNYYTPETNYKKEIFSLIKNTFQSSQNLAEAFARLMTKLFGKYGLVLIDPMLPGVRSLLKGAVNRSLQFSGELNKKVNEKAATFSKLGIKAPIEKAENSTNLFIYDSKNRLPLNFTDASFYYDLGEERINLTKAEVEELLDHNPARFSPSVVLRPVFQDILLPTLCYVGGPGEIAYYGQLKDVYSFFNLEMPIIYPRARLTMVEPWVKEILKEYGLKERDINKGLDNILEHLLKEKLPVNIELEIRNITNKYKEEYRVLVEKLAVIDPDLLKISEGNFERMEYQLKYLEKKAWQKHRKKHQQILFDFDRLKSYFYPLGKPQERVYNLIPFVLGYGFDYIDYLMLGITVSEFEHQFIGLGAE